MDYSDIDPTSRMRKPKFVHNERVRTSTQGRKALREKCMANLPFADNLHRLNLTPLDCCDRHSLTP